MVECGVARELIALLDSNGVVASKRTVTYEFKLFSLLEDTLLIYIYIYIYHNRKAVDAIVIVIDVDDDHAVGDSSARARRAAQIRLYVYQSLHLRMSFVVCN